MAEVEPRIIFHQAFVKRHDFALARHHRESCNPNASHSIADNVDSARIGSNISANLTGPTGGEVNGIKQAHLARSVLDGLSNCASPYSH